MRARPSSDRRPCRPPERVTRHPLSGIRRATTDPQLALLDRAGEVLRRDERILAAWLVGSLARRSGRRVQDVDVQCCIDDQAVDSLAGDGWKSTLAHVERSIGATMTLR